VGFIQGISRTLGKLLVVIALLATFLVGLLGVVWMSLKGDEVKVPQIIGKDVLESEKELASLGLKLKKRANRFSKENPNTILEQLPKSGETVKTGQTISVVISKLDPESTEEPATVDEDVVSNSTTADNKPKKEKKVEKKASTTRDVESNKAKISKNGNSSNVSNVKNSNTAKVENKNAETKLVNKSNSTTTIIVKPTPASSNKLTKPASGGDLRPRKIPQ
jgi:beta-lactam-binding protein with PASTA domain